MDSVKDEKQEWIQGILDSTYTYRGRVELGRVTFDDLTEEETWKKIGTTIDSGANPRITKNPVHYLSFAMNIIQCMKEETPSNINGNGEKKIF